MKRILIFTSILGFLALLGRTILFASAADVPTQFMRHQFTGVAKSTEVYGVSYPIVAVSASGSGTATELGQFTLVYQGDINFTDLSTVETAQLVGLDGNSIIVTGVGQATATTTPGIYNLLQIYKVTGGTGRFAGAKGTITLDRNVDMMSGMTHSTLDGYLLLPSRN